MTNNPEQIDLFDNGQAEFYSTQIEQTPKAPKKLHPMTIAKKLHEAKAKEYPTYINNKVLTSYIGGMMLAEIVDIRKNHKMNTIEVIYSVVTPDDVELYACDPIGLQGVPEVYVHEKMLAYLQMYPTQGTPEKQAKRTMKAMRSLTAFYAAIRSRMLRAQMDNRPIRVLIEPCMSVRGNVYLKIHNPACSQ